MKTIKIKVEQEVQLLAKISSVANVGSNVSLDDSVIKKSKQYQFSIALGKIDSIDGNILSVTSNFFNNTGNYDAVFNDTKVSYELKFGDEAVSLSEEKVKINKHIFMCYTMVKLVKA